MAFTGMTFRGWVVHVVPPNGGGVDRHVRDICSLRPQDTIVHAAEDVLILELPATGQTHSLSMQLDSQRFASLLGRPALIHAHSTVKAVRAAVALLCSVADCPFVLTLHDVEFAVDQFNGDAAPDGSQRISFLLGARAVMGPSQFICRIADTRLPAPSNACRFVENGITPLAQDRPATPPSWLEGLEGPFSVAVVGALGQHKGLGFLMEVADSLPEAVKIVVIGYADGHLTSGWLVPDRVWVHGPFEPTELAYWTAAYGVQVAFFPNRQPESYCYALSDVWVAGLPAIVPNHGALGERVATHGGGWLYPPDASAEVVADFITGCLSAVASMGDQVAVATSHLKSVEDMVKQIEAVYRSQTVDQMTSKPDFSGLADMPRVHLDSRFFRKEILRLAGELRALQDQQDRTLKELRDLGDTNEKRGEWIAHQQEAVEQLQHELQRVEGLRLAEHQEALVLSNELIALRARHAALQEEYVEKAELAQKYLLIRQRVIRLTAWVPPWLRRRINKLVSTIVLGRNSS